MVCECKTPAQKPPLLLSSILLLIAGLFSQQTFADGFSEDKKKSESLQDRCCNKSGSTLNIPPLSVSFAGNFYNRVRTEDEDYAYDSDSLNLYIRTLFSDEPDKKKPVEPLAELYTDNSGNDYVSAGLVSRLCHRAKDGNCKQAPDGLPENYWSVSLDYESDGGVSDEQDISEEDTSDDIDSSELNEDDVFLRLTRRGQIFEKVFANPRMLLSADLRLFENVVRGSGPDASEHGAFSTELQLALPFEGGRWTVQPVLSYESRRRWDVSTELSYTFTADILMQYEIQDDSNLFFTGIFGYLNEKNTDSYHASLGFLYQFEVGADQDKSFGGGNRYYARRPGRRRN